MTEKRPDRTVEGPHITDVEAARAHQARLRDREVALAARHQADGESAVRAAIQLDRAARWGELLGSREENAGIREWAARMAEAKRNPLVQMRGHAMPWVTALYVVRYGESEHYWPAQLGEADLARATQWLLGKTPDALAYLPPVEG